MYAAQVIPPLDAEIAEKGHFWMETGWIPCQARNDCIGKKKRMPHGLLSRCGNPVYGPAEQFNGWLQEPQRGTVPAEFYNYERGKGFSMRVLFYMKGGKGLRKRADKVVSAVSKLAEVKMCGRLAELTAYFSRPRISTEPSIAVLFAKDKQDLQEIVSVRHLLEQIKILLVLPEAEDETILLGHSLYPRYVTYQDGDLEDMAAVLGKMLGREERISEPCESVSL